MGDAAMLLTISWDNTLPLLKGPKHIGTFIASSNVCISVLFFCSKIPFCSFRSVRFCWLHLCYPPWRYFPDELRVKHKVWCRKQPGTRTIHYDLHILNLFVGYLQSVDQSGTRYNSRAMLVIVHHRYVQLFFKSSFNFETFRCFFISSRLIPPKVGAMAFNSPNEFIGSFSSISMSNTSIPA